MTVHQLLAQTTTAPVPAGSLTISYVTISLICAAIFVGVGAGIKTLAYFSPTIDKFFGNKNHDQQAYLSTNFTNSLLEASEKRPLILHAVMKEVPAEMVLRMSSAERSIAELEAAHIRAEEKQTNRYEGIMGAIGGLREALAGQGFRVDHPNGGRA